MKKYRTSDLYIIKLARITKIGLNANKNSEYTLINELYAATKDTYKGYEVYKLVNYKNVFAYADSKKVKFVGDIFVSSLQPFNYFYSKEKISAKEIEKFEKDINKNVRQNFTEQREQA